MSDHEPLDRDEIENLLRQYGQECADTMVTSRAADPDLAAAVDPIWREIEVLRASVANWRKWADDLRAEGAVKELRSAIEELERLDDGRTTGYHSAGRHIIARLRARADAMSTGHWSDPTPAGEVCRCLCHESGPALEHLDGGKCPCRTSGAINPNHARKDDR